MCTHEFNQVVMQTASIIQLKSFDNFYRMRPKSVLCRHQALHTTIYTVQADKRLDY